MALLSSACPSTIAGFYRERHASDDLVAQPPEELRSFGKWFLPNGLCDENATFGRYLIDDRGLTTVTYGSRFAPADRLWNALRLLN